MASLELPVAEKVALSRRSTLNPYSLLRPSRSRQSDAEEPGEGSTRRAVSQDGRRSDVGDGLATLDLMDTRDTTATKDLRTKSKGSEFPHRFSLLRFRNASEPQLGLKARAQAEEDIPPIPLVPSVTENIPSIMTTAPTMDVLTVADKPVLKRSRSRFRPFARPKAVTTEDIPEEIRPKSSEDRGRERVEKRKSRFGSFRPNRNNGLEDLRKLAGSRGSGELQVPNGNNTGRTTPSLGVHSSPRKSTSSRSENLDNTNTSSFSSSQQGTNPQDRSHPLSTNPSSSFAWLSSRKKQNRKSLFPLPVKFDPSTASQSSRDSRDPPSTPRASITGRTSYSPEHSPINPSPLQNTLSNLDIGDADGPSFSAGLLAASSVNIAAAGTAPLLLRSQSTQSARSNHSSPDMKLNLRNRGRKRSLTWGSGLSDDPPPTPPFALNGTNGSGRNSMSTAGRSSFSNLFVLNRLRHSSDPHSPRQSSQSHGQSLTSAENSHHNSLQLSREIPLPEREEGETAITFLSRVEEIMHKSQILSAVAKNDNEFMQTVMRSFMRKFAFFGDPMDMAIRKLLMEVDLPKETQQIDRTMQSFADRYHECNPGIFASPDDAYITAFSILILQTDVFNKSNKRKMTKPDYVKNTSIAGVSEDVLDCFYDNIAYTPFIRVEDDDSIKQTKSKRKKKAAKAAKAAKVVKAAVAVDPAERKPLKEPVDPYLLILDDKLDLLRPPIREVMNLEDPYSYLGSVSHLSRETLKMMKAGIIQIVSARSRPDAFLSPSGIENPDEAQAGIVELPVDKVGLLWRKDPKKKTARSPWQEWGAILTGAGLYFFKDSKRIKEWLYQYENHLKHGGSDTPCLFKPPVPQFNPDYMIPTEHGVALQDSNYKRHKNAFSFFRPNNPEEIFLADNEQEMNDWLAKLNQQAAFKTAGVRPRGLVGGNYDGQRQRALRRLASDNSGAATQTIQTSSGEVTIQRGRIDNDLAQQISLARQDAMRQKIEQGEDELAKIIKKIDTQLRDCRHLLIMAPIQQKTREHLLLAAGRMAANLKVIRIQMWRKKCHRDILALDLVEEKKEMERRQARLDPSGIKTDSIASLSSMSTARAHSQQHSSDRVTSAASLVAGSSPARAGSSPVPRPDTKSSLTSMLDSNEDDVFRTPPENSPVIGALEDGEWEPLKIKPHRLSLMSFRSPRPQQEFTDALEAPQSPAFSEYKTPTLDDEEARRKRQGSISSPIKVDAKEASLTDASQPRPGTPTDAELSDAFDNIMPGSPDTRKPRRPMQRTLRESSNPHSHRDTGSGHHRHRGSLRSKGDSTTSANLEDAPADAKPAVQVMVPTGSADAVLLAREIVKTSGDGEPQLKREKGSFTVHGKKASVITFDADWTNITPEERLRMRKAHSSTTTPSVEVYTPSRPGSYLSSPALPSSARRPSTFSIPKTDEEFAVVDEEDDKLVANGVAAVDQQQQSSSSGVTSKIRSSPISSSSPAGQQKGRQRSVSSRSSVATSIKLMTVQNDNQHSKGHDSAEVMDNIQHEDTTAASNSPRAANGTTEIVQNGVAAHETKPDQGPETVHASA